MKIITYKWDKTYPLIRISRLPKANKPKKWLYIVWLYNWFILVNPEK